MNKLQTICPWEAPLVHGRLIQRRHRFLLDVLLDDGRQVTAHCASPGRMEGLIRSGAEVWLSKAPEGTGRSLSWSWELVRCNKELIGTNSWTTNILVHELLKLRLLKGFKTFQVLEVEKTINQTTRIDFLATGSRGKHYVEVKGGHLVKVGDSVYFPDSKTSRSIRHLNFLVRAIKKGHAASLFIVVQRAQAKSVKPSDFHDPSFASALRKAKKNGLVIRALLFKPTIRGFIFKGELPVDLEPYDTEVVQLWSIRNRPFGGWKRPTGDPQAAWRKKDC